jgi:hypothetical protein
MHIVGVELCVLLHQTELTEASEVAEVAEAVEADDAFDLCAALGPVAARVLLCKKQLADYDIKELQTLVTTLQLEFACLYELDSVGCDRRRGSHLRARARPSRRTPHRARAAAD